MKYKVTTTWTVEVTDAEVRSASAKVGMEVDPKKLATFKAIHKSIEVALNEGQWDGGVSVYFDVEPITN